MEIEKLTKSQIVLLTLLVSFMTSMTTGIVTVALMEQAPPAITETVNRVVERTVEKVVPGQAAAVATPIVTTKTVVVKESDLIPQAVDMISSSLVRLYSTDATDPAFLGLGIVMDTSSTIMMDQASLAAASDVVVELSGSAKIRGVVRSQDEKTGIAYVTTATSTPDGPISWKPAQFAASRPPLGKSVILISGKSSNRVAQGLVTSLSSASQIETDIGKDVIMQGSPIIDTDGRVLGVSTKVSRSSDASGFIAGISLLPQNTEGKGDVKDELKDKSASAK